MGKPAEVQDCVYTAPKEEEAAAPVTIAPPEDVCPNIEGIQTQVPEGMVKDDNGNCVTAPQAQTGFAALTGAVASALSKPSGIIGAVIALVLVGAALYAGYSYLYKKKEE